MPKLSKLSVGVQEQIWRLTLAGKSSRELAAQFDVSQSTVSAFLRERRAEIAAQAKATPEAQALRAVMADPTMSAEIKLEAALKLKALSQPKAPDPEPEKDINLFALAGIGLGPDYVYTPPTLSAPTHEEHEERVARAEAAIRRAEDDGDTLKANSLRSMFQRQGLIAKPEPPAPPPPPVPTAEEIALAEWKTLLPHEQDNWRRNAEHRIRMCLSDEQDEVERIKASMRARGLRPVGDPDSMWPAPELRHIELADMERERVEASGRRRAPGAIVEWVNGSWKEWSGE